MASASPSASITVVLDVGARFNGQASCSMFTSRNRWAFCATVDFGSPHMAMILTWKRAIAGRIRTISSVSPLALKNFYVQDTSGLFKVVHRSIYNEGRYCDGQEFARLQ